METVAFLIFCLGIGYVIVWVIANERRGSADGEWGLIGIRKQEPSSKQRDGRSPGAERP